MIMRVTLETDGVDDGLSRKCSGPSNESVFYSFLSVMNLNVFSRISSLSLYGIRFGTRVAFQSI